MWLESYLYYFHDPMCSWCWAFRPVLRRVEARLPEGIRLVRVLGGLAPDTDEPMPQAMRERLQAIWRSIEVKVPGTVFDFSYWDVQTPRRSTYRACRAVIAATRLGGLEQPMIEAIQRAYYQRALNPSDRPTLIALAGELGLDTERFGFLLDHPETQVELARQITMTRERGVSDFPALMLETDGQWRPIGVDYHQSDAILRQLSTP